jgi:hypothetical protein
MDLTKLMQQARAWNADRDAIIAHAAAQKRGGRVYTRLPSGGLLDTHASMTSQALPVMPTLDRAPEPPLPASRSMQREVPQGQLDVDVLNRQIAANADKLVGREVPGIVGLPSKLSPVTALRDGAAAAATMPFGGHAVAVRDATQKSLWDDKVSGLDKEQYGYEGQPGEQKPAGKAPSPYVTLGSGSTTVKRGPQALAGMEGMLQDLGDQKVAGKKQQIEGQMELADKKADIFQKADQEFEAVHRTAEKKIGELAAKHAELEAQYDTARKEAAGEKVNPDQWWSSRNGGQKGMMLLAVALGGFNEGFTRGRLKNTALQIMNREIDRDIDAQKSNIAKKRGERQEMLGIMGNLQGRIKDERAVEMNTRIMLQQDMGRRMQQAAMKVQDPILRGQMMMASAAIQEDTLVKKNQAYMSRQATTVKTSSWRQAPNPLMRAAAAGKVPPSKFLEAFASARDGYQLFSKAAGKLKDLGGYGYISRYMPGTESARIRDNYLVPLAVSLRKMRETGVMTEPDFQRYKRILDSPFASGKELQIRIGEIQQDAVQKMRGMVQTYGQFYNLRGIGGMIPSGPGQSGSAPQYETQRRGERALPGDF